MGWPCQDFTQGSNREQPKRLMREMITAWAWINCQTNQAGENSLFLMHCTGGDLSQGHGRTAKFRIVHITSASSLGQTSASPDLQNVGICMGSMFAGGKGGGRKRDSGSQDPNILQVCCLAFCLNYSPSFGQSRAPSFGQSRATG